MHGSDFQEENRTIPATESTGKPVRRYDLDWLRVLVILNLVPWHAAWLMAFVTGFSDSTREGFGITILRYYTGFSLRWQVPAEHDRYPHYLCLSY